MSWMHQLPDRRIVIDAEWMPVEIIVQELGDGPSLEASSKISDKVLVLVHDNASGRSDVAQELLDQFGIDLDLAVVAEAGPRWNIDGKTYRKFLAPVRVMAGKGDGTATGEYVVDHLLQYANDAVGGLEPAPGVRVRRVVEDQMAYQPSVTPAFYYLADRDTAAGERAASSIPEPGERPQNSSVGKPAGPSDHSIPRTPRAPSNDSGPGGGG